MARRLLDYDPLTGVRTYHDYEHRGRKTIIEVVQDVAPFLDVSKELAKDTDRSKRGIKDSWWHVAKVPIGVQYKWLREHGVNLLNKHHWPGVKRLLNDRDYSHIRTSPGRV